MGIKKRVMRMVYILPAVSSVLLFAFNNCSQNGFQADSLASIGSGTQFATHLEPGSGPGGSPVTPGTANLVFTKGRLVSGYQHNCMIAKSGQVRCWGDNGVAQLGDGTYTNRTSPINLNDPTSYKYISSLNHHTCGITSSDKLKCWGHNYYGQIGDGSSKNNKSSPVEVDSSLKFKTVSAGVDHTCAVTTAGQMKCWGNNDLGQVGDGTTQTRSAPIVIDSKTTYKTVSAGSRYTCGITTSDQIKCWGSDPSRIVVGGNSVGQPVPTLLDASNTYLDVSAGSEWRACARTLSNEIRCWGLTGVGDGTEELRRLPTKVDSSTKYMSVQVSSSGATSCGITSTGKLKCWGWNNWGQLGLGDNAHRLAPVDIAEPASFTEVATGSGHTCGITNLNQIKCWGWNSIGQIGDGTNSDKNLPILILSNID